MDARSTLDVQHACWDRIPIARVGEGIERQVFGGARLMVCRVRFAPGVVTPLHTHPHEQMTLVQQGRVRFTVGDRSWVAGPGDLVCFPSNIAHAAATLDEDAILLDVFSPVREDFLPQPGDVGR